MAAAAGEPPSVSRDSRSEEGMRVRRVIPILLGLLVYGAEVFAQQPSGIPEPLYPVFSDGRWGMINASGQLVLPLRFESVAHWPDPWNPARFSEPAHAATSIGSPIPVQDAVIPVRLNGQAALATRDGRLLALGRYDRIWSFREGRAWVRLAGGWGLIDEAGNLVAPPRDFEDVRLFDGGYAFVKLAGRWAVIDRDGREVVSPTWDEVNHAFGDQWAGVRTGSRWGVIERSGKIVIPPRFEEIGRPLPPLIFAVDSSQAVYIRPDGTVAFEITCPRGLLSTPRARGSPFFFGTSAVVRCGRRVGLIDPQGKFLLEPTWDVIRPVTDERHYDERRYEVISRGELAGLIDAEGRWIFKAGELASYSDIRYCRNGILVFSVSAPRRRRGMVDLNGRVVIPASFGQLGCFDDDGIAVARTPMEEGFKAGYIDRTGSWLVKPEFRQANRFRGPLATANKPVARDTTELVYIDRSGKVVYRMQHKGFIYDDQVLRQFK